MEKLAYFKTQNAMLLIKIAQLQKDLLSLRTKNISLSEAHANSLNINKSNLSKLRKLSIAVQGLGGSLSDLKNVVGTFLGSFSGLCNDVVRNFSLISESYPDSDINDLKYRVDKLESELSKTKHLYESEKRRRRLIHNTLMELRGNIRVICRIRPLMPFDCGTQQHLAQMGAPGTPSETIVFPIDDEQLSYVANKTPRPFEFDKVLPPNEGQTAVFAEVRDMLTSLLDGYNVCIMAYGQTSSGKTHSMLGKHSDERFITSATVESEDDGIIPRATRELFSLVADKPPGQYSLEISIVEIYNNEIRDLLSHNQQQKHEIVTNFDGSVQLPTVVVRAIDSPADVIQLISYGLETRHQTSTLIHQHSSRSHLVVQITVTSHSVNFIESASSSSEILPLSSRASSPSPRIIMRSAEQVRKFSGMSYLPRSRSPSPARFTSNNSVANVSFSQNSVVRTKLQLVDLAGSECIAMSGVKGEHLRETCSINKSLSALADVLSALAEKRPHIPYRNSKLTHMLQESIGGDAKLLLLLCVGPAMKYHAETLQCLNFGTRARHVERGPAKKRQHQIFSGDTSGRSSPLSSSYTSPRVFRFLSHSDSKTNG